MKTKQKNYESLFSFFGCGLINYSSPKKIKQIGVKQIFFITVMVLLSFIGNAQTMLAKIGNNPGNINTTAVLEVESTTKGFLPPRMTQTQRDAITTPAEGLVVYCTNCAPKGFYHFNGTAWDNLNSGVGGSLSVVSNCATNGFTGAYINGIALSGASFSTTITNNSLSQVPLTFAAGDLSLSGVTGFSVGTPSPASATIDPGASQTITYPITGTPASTGTLTGSWSKLTLNCTNTKVVPNGLATFTLPQRKEVLSFTNTSPLVNIQGYVTNTAPNQIVINVPYTGGLGSYVAYSGGVVTGTAGEGGDTNGFSISYPSGTFAASGTIPVTVTVDGDGSYSAKQQLAGASEVFATIPFVVNGITYGNIQLVVIGGVKDRMFGIADNNGNTNTHNFIYTPITGADGKTWLNNNLGAHYANLNHASFNPEQQATSATDHLAYGSLFQWGRKPDGHELMTWTSGTAGTVVNGTTSTNSDVPSNALFILEPGGLYDWRVLQDDNLWATEASANNPCPVGYRVPTQTELNTLITAASITNSATAASSTLKFTVPGNRSNTAGSLSFAGTNGYYWSSSVSGTSASTRRFLTGSTLTTNFNRAFGLTVRCIKD